MKEIFYATNNPGKIFEVSKHLTPQEIKIISPKDLNINLDVEENGSTLEENAKLKTAAYIELVKNMPIIADDTGVEIDALDGAPGIHVRRWKDGKTRMSDQEIIDYCMALMKDVPAVKRGAQFRTVISLYYNSEFFSAEGTLKGKILENPGKETIKGFPFETLFYITEYEMPLWQLHELTGEEKEKYLTHREKAIQKALPKLLSILED
jgi:XTP/dITP diphosphohydrolase